MKRKIIFFLSILISIGIGFSIGFFVAKSLSPNIETLKKSIVNELRQKLNSKIEKNLLVPMFGFRFPSQKITTKAFSGEITKIEGDIVEVKVRNVYSGGDLFEFLDEPEFYIKKVKIEKDTKIVERELKETKEVKKETTAMKEKSFQRPFPVFESFVEKEISKEELKEGTLIAIEAKSEFKLEEDKTIEAEKIILTKLEK